MLLTCFTGSTTIRTWGQNEPEWLRQNNGLFTRAIHNIENSYFRTKFEVDLPTFAGKSGIGVISDTDAQPIIINCHLGKFAIVTVAKINNMPELEKELLAKGNHFCEHSNGLTNQSELVSMLIIEGKNFVDGIENVYNRLKGSCSHVITNRKWNYCRPRQIRTNPRL